MTPKPPAQVAPTEEDLKLARDLVSIHRIEDRCVFVAHAIGDARKQGRSEGRAAGLEEAAHLCDVFSETTMGARIRALKDK